MQHRPLHRALNGPDHCRGLIDTTKLINSESELQMTTCERCCGGDPAYCPDTTCTTRPFGGDLGPSTEPVTVYNCGSYNKTISVLSSSKSRTITQCYGEERASASASVSLSIVAVICSMIMIFFQN